MNRTVLILQVGVVLTVSAWLGTTSPQELLPKTESATRFQIHIGQMAQSGGCLTEISGPCPAWGNPEDELCGCSGPSDTGSCSPAEAQGEVEEDTEIWRTRAWYNYENNPGIGFGGSIQTPILCVKFYTCQPGCIPNAFDNGFHCNIEQVSELYEEDSYRGDPDMPQFCNVYFYVQQTRESQQSAQLAMVSGIGLQLFTQE